MPGKLASQRLTNGLTADEKSFSEGGLRTSGSFTKRIFGTKAGLSSEITDWGSCEVAGTSTQRAIFALAVDFRFSQTYSRIIAILH
jgi:hypothetical protein